jgi:hypothetical protein
MTTEMTDSTSRGTDAPRRPGGVTFVVVLAYIASIFTVLNGFFVMLDADTRLLQLDSGLSEDQLMWAGIVTIIVGVIGILLTAALARGSQVVRILFTIWIAFQIAAGLASMIGHTGEERASGVVPFVFGIVILLLLFSSRADEFFRSRHEL